MARRRARSGAVDEVARLIGGVVRILIFLWKRPRLSVSIIAGAGTGFLVDHWFTVTGQTQAIVTASVFVAALVILTLLVLTYGAIYVVMGLHPVTGERRVVYVGLTTQEPWIDRDGIKRWPRIEQHLFGSERWESTPKPWADTVTDWHFVRESYWFLVSRLKVLEIKSIHRLLPLYNDLHNRRNPHRIGNTTAIAQRAQRDRGQFTQRYWEAMQINRPLLARR
jgi:hypothetical protein